MKYKNMGLLEELERARKGHMVRFETKSRSPKGAYLVRAFNIGMYYDLWGELDWARDAFLITSKRGAGLVIAWDREWPGPRADAWVYRTTTNRLGDRTRLVGFEVTDLPFDPHEWFDAHMAEAWPHV